MPDEVWVVVRDDLVLGVWDDENAAKKFANDNIEAWEEKFQDMGLHDIEILGWNLVNTGVHGRPVWHNALNGFRFDPMERQWNIFLVPYGGYE